MSKAADPAAEFSRAQQAEQQGRRAEAEAIYRGLVTQDPRNHVAWHALGVLYFLAGKLTLAIQMIEAAISVYDKAALYHRNVGEMYRRAGQVDKAIQAGRLACKLAPRDVDAHHNLAVAYADGKNPAKAVETCRKALRFNPRHVALWNVLSEQLERQGDREGALKAYEEAAKVDPRQAVAPNSVALSQGKAQSGGAGLPAGSGSAEQWHMQGLELYRAGKFDEALACLDRSLEMQPEAASTYNSKGFLLQDIGRMDEALGCFERAVSLSPELAMARLNLGMAQLKLGQWKEGWENYEARWTGSAEAGAGTVNRPTCPMPMWHGEQDTAGKRLLVITEQGFGDTFQFTRYLALAAKRFAKVGYVCAQPTQRLMEWSFGKDIITLTQMPADPEGYEAWDLYCPLMSLPRAFGTTLDTIPAEVPYLHASESLAAHWRERLENAAPKRFRVGIAWAGRKAHQYDSRRSLSFEQIQPLLANNKVTWVSLQKWAPEDRRPDTPPNIDWIDWTEELSDFGDTAALLASLDLVISVDSSMVHLAAGLGRPVWLLDRFDNEWRWLQDRADSPWYPTLRIFRQPAFGDWRAVLQTLKDELALLPALQESGPAKPRAAKRKQPPAQAAEPAKAASSAQTLTPEQAMQVAAQLQSAGRLPEAEGLLQQVLAVNPRHAHALHLLGVVAWQTNQRPKALQLIGQAIEADSTVALFHANLTEMLRQQGQVDEAIRHGERAVALDPAMASAHSNLGIAYFDRKELDRAEACHRQALHLMPNLLQSLNNLGSIEQARGNLAAAAEWYRKALEVNPDFLESLSNLGVTLLDSNDLEEAVAPLLRALQLAPGFPPALANLGRLRLKQKRAQEAVDLLRRALQVRPHYLDAMTSLAHALRALGQGQEADRLEAIVGQAVLADGHIAVNKQ